MYACACRLAKLTFVSHAVVRVGGLEALIMSVLREPFSKHAPCLAAHVIFVL